MRINVLINIFIWGRHWFRRDEWVFRSMWRGGRPTLQNV